MGRTHKDARVNYTKKESGNRKKDLQRKKEKKFRHNGKNLLKVIDVDSGDIEDVEFALDVS